MLTVVSTPAMPWDRRAPEREGPPSAWALLPEDLAAQGCPGRPEHVFARLQRVRTWRPDGLFLAREIRAWLEAHTDLSLPAILERHPSADGSTKLVLGLADGHRVEAVHMPRRRRRSAGHLLHFEPGGVRHGLHLLRDRRHGHRAQPDRRGDRGAGRSPSCASWGRRSASTVYLVFMGMGEPLHNLDHVHRAITVLCHPEGAASRRGASR